MTASPAAAPMPRTKMANFNSDAPADPLRALFAAAAASSMERQKAVAATGKPAPHIKPTTSTPIAPAKPKHKSNGTTPLKATATKKAVPQTKTATNEREPEMSAANLIASLLNGTTKTSLTSPRFASASSLPLTKTTATFTTTTAVKSQPTQPKQISSAHQKAATSAVAAKEKPSVLQSSKQASLEKAPEPIELRALESWHDEDEVKMDDDCYQELVDSTNFNGWSADEMFKYNERRHKVKSSYSEKTLSDKYTTPLPKNKSKSTARIASKLAKEIEERAAAEGRVTPESSDDDELFERERQQRMQLKKLKQLVDLKDTKMIGKSNGVSRTQNRFSLDSKETINHNPPNNDISVISTVYKSAKSSSEHSNSSATPATASLSSSPTMNDTHNISRVSASSSRNILRTCLT